MYTETARSLFIKKVAVRHPVQIIHNVLTIITAVIIQWIWDKIVNSLIKLTRLSGSGTLDLSSVSFAAIFQNGDPVRVSIQLCKFLSPHHLDQEANERHALSRISKPVW